MYYLNCVKRLTQTLPILLLFVQIAAGAQEAQQQTVGPADLEAMANALNRNIAQIQTITADIHGSERIDLDALIYRRDVRAYKLFQDYEALVNRMASVPDSAPYRQRLIAQLTTFSDAAGDAIFERITEIEQRVNQADKVLAASSGKDRVEQTAFFQNLEDIRAKYYESLLKLLNGRKALGLGTDDLRARLSTQTGLYAEALAGRVQLIANSRSQIQQRAKQMPDNADIKAALLDLDVRHRRNLRRLETMIPVLDGLGIDSSGYKAVLLQQAGSISVNLFSTQALYSVLGETWTAMKTAFRSNGADFLFRLFVFVAVLFVFRLLSRLTRRLVRAASDRSRLAMSSLLKNMLVTVSGGTVMLIGILIALSNIGISLTPMLAGLGVAGFIVGFALQDSLSNFAAGAMILIYRPFDVNDFIEVTDASGLVKKMNLVSTTIVTFDNQTLVVPNRKIWGDVIKNVTAQKVRRVDLQFGISYADDIELAERVFREIVESHEKVLDDPEPNIRLHSLGDSSVNFIVRPWTKTEDYWTVYWDITREVKLRLDKEGISIPFPQRDVHLFTQKDD